MIDKQFVRRFKIHIALSGSACQIKNRFSRFTIRGVHPYHREGNKTGISFMLALLYYKFAAISIILA
jgi:hypothetical protein